MARTDDFIRTDTPVQNAQHMGGPSFAPYLEKIAFPQSRKAIIKLAEENEADPVFLGHLRRIPETAFNSIEEIRKALDEEYENYGMVRKNAENISKANKAVRD